MRAGPVKAKKRRPHSNDASTGATQFYSSHAVAQIIPLPSVRPCASCGVFVGNVNLGGHDGRSALSGELFCLKCADRVHEHVTNDGETRS
jgi:hypothetical protein